jgi:hypothetical protein
LDKLLQTFTYKGSATSLQYGSSKHQARLFIQEVIGKKPSPNPSAADTDGVAGVNATAAGTESDDVFHDAQESLGCDGKPLVGLGTNVAGQTQCGICLFWNNELVEVCPCQVGAKLKQVST